MGDLATIFAQAVVSWFAGPAIVGLIVAHFLGARIKAIEAETGKTLKAIEADNAKALEQIKQVNAENLEHLKAELRADAFAQEIRFSKIYDHEVMALVELLRRAVAAEQAAMIFVYRNENGIPQAELPLAAVGAFVLHAQENAIWIPDAIVPLLKEFEFEAIKWTLLPTVLGRAPAQSGEESIDRIKCGELSNIRERLADEIRVRLPTLGARQP